jgi:hypothetical protein
MRTPSSKDIDYGESDMKMLKPAFETATVDSQKCSTPAIRDTIGCSCAPKNTMAHSPLLASFRT